VIARLRGRVVARSPAGVVLDVNGVGYLVAATASVLGLESATADDGEITVETHLHVREDALQLYGFASVEERELFELLLGVSGVGPKVALAIVSGSSPSELRRAIARDDLKRFEAIPGVGRKTAQRVVLELKEKLTAADLAGARDRGGEALTARDALVELGWSLVDAERALARLEPGLAVEEQVRLALRAVA
jgi:holliday junction DNA helicase RuvA